MPDLNLSQFLVQNQHADLLRFTTAGSVDDGKSTLIGRLLHDCKCIYEDHLDAIHRDSKRLNREEVDLALVTDGLKAEREQGITIDVAYRYFSTPKRRFIIADTPGHEQYTRNMVTGASTANLAIVLIDARHGVLTQSRRHGFIASLLGIPHVVVAVNKMDLVDFREAAFEEIREAYTEYAAKLNIHDLLFIPLSALRGDNVVSKSTNMDWYQGTTLLHHLENVEIVSDRNLVDFRFPVQYVNRPTQDFRGFCGTVCSGVVRPGDAVVALPSGRRSRVKAVVNAQGDMPYAFPPQAVTLCLEDELDISRGDLLAHPGNVPKVTRSVEAMVVWMAEEPCRLNQPYIIKHTTNALRGVFASLAYRVNPNTLHRETADELKLNEIGRVTLELYRPLVCDPYVRNRGTGSFIVVDPQSHGTVAAGMILEREALRPEAGNPAAVAAPVSTHITAEGSLVTAADRERLLGHTAVTVWLTGLSGSGKSTIAKLLERRLIDTGHACFVLDGDNLRHGLNRDLGFSAADRSENIRRVAEVARLMNEAGLIVITSFISPYRADREQARQVIGTERFLEVHVQAPLAVCEKRDPKGLYRKARAGEIASFTGLSAPYEAPEKPDLLLDTEALTPDDAVTRLLDRLQAGR